jgi:hypothetical protein
MKNGIEKAHRNMGFRIDSMCSSIVYYVSEPAPTKEGWFKKMLRREQNDEWALRCVLGKLAKHDHSVVQSGQ